ncbi:MAG TPA: hypothetical protein VI457_10085 [Methylococcaceae bacterium]|nr:hypothetical protein [Methylococcaceae bacterium]
MVIISVKDNEYRETGDKTGWERWTKAALEKSYSQIWGAERWLERVDRVVRADGRVVFLPGRSSRQYHRIAVALGAHGEVPLKWGDAGNGFVHVCDEYSIGALFLVLDTITDFVDFLRASEGLVKGGVFPLFSGGGIEDLVAFYLLQGRSLQFEAFDGKHPDMLILHDDLWQGLVKSDDFKSMQKDLKDSYVWDNLIEHYTDDLLTGGMFDMHSRQVTNNELALVTMALQPRMHRAVLADAFLQFLQNAEMKSAARVVSGHGDTAFVFTVGSSADREFRARELMLRCLVVRGRLPGVTTVVGIATDRPGTSKVGYSSDIVYVHMPEWTEKDEQDVQGIQRDLGYFKEVRWGK